MKRWKRTAQWILLGSTALGAGQLAPASGIVVDPDADSCRRIAERNPFRLRSPSPAAVAKPLPSEPKEKPVIEITGVTDVTGSLLALAEIRFPNQVTHQHILAVGSQIGGIEVRDIDVRSGTVTMRSQGKESRLGLRAGLSPAALARNPLSPKGTP